MSALAIFVLAWQLVVWSNWKPQYLLPSPFTVFDAMWQHPGAFTHNAGVTLGHAAIGLAAAIAVGGAIGLVAAAIGPLRAPVRSIVAGLETLPAVAWYPAALIVIGTSWYSILFVIVIGAAPPIARGILEGVGRSSRRRRDASESEPRGLVRLRTVVLPGSLVDVLAGVRRGWLLCWTALLTGEILLTLPSLGLGGQLAFERGLNDNVAVYEVMVVIFVLGVLVDGVVFGTATNVLQRRRAVSG